MPMRFNDTENLRGNQKTPPSQVPAGRGSRGRDAGGRENTRANFQAPPTSVPAPAKGRSDRRPSGIRTYRDKEV